MFLIWVFLHYGWSFRNKMCVCTNQSSHFRIWFSAKRIRATHYKLSKLNEGLMKCVNFALNVLHSPCRVWFERSFSLESTSFTESIKCSTFSVLSLKSNRIFIFCHILHRLWLVFPCICQPLQWISFQLDQD